MPLPESYPKCVLFVGRGSGSSGRIAGTGFLVGLETEHDRHYYVVTAAHVIEGAAETFVRVPVIGGGTRDEQIHDWIPHGKHDIAVAPIAVMEDADLVATGVEDQFIDSERDDDWKFGPIELGSVVYFLGLLGKVQAMTDRNIPVVRSGVLSRLWQDALPVKRSPKDATKYITAHLIDCRSFAGFSGSPCYVQTFRVAWFERDTKRGYTIEYRTLLLGLIGGHFDDWVGIKTRLGSDDDAVYEISDDVQAPVSTGIAYVIPAEFIRETLMREELVEMRERDEARAAEEAKREDEDNAATMDSAEQSEFDRFEDLTRKLVNTPKSAIDEKRKPADSE